MTADELNALDPMLGLDGSALAAWDFNTNLAGGGEVLLSFDIGWGAQDVQVWHLSGGTWSVCTPSMFTYDSNGAVSFPVTSFSGYAVTGVAPVP
jgi:hypothetical protein